MNIYLSRLGKLYNITGDEVTGTQLSTMPKHGKIECFDLTETNWTSYVERLEYYFAANDIPADKTKSTLAVCGSTTFELAKNLADTSFTDILKALKNHCLPELSPIIQRFKFNSRQRLPGESIHAYIAALQALGEHCKFGATLNDMIRDCLVCGVNDRAIQRRLLQESDLNYKTAYDIMAKNALDLLAGSTTTTQVKQLRSGLPSHSHKQHLSQTTHTTTKSAAAKPICHRCGTTGHLATVCRFKEAICHHCGKKRHLSKACNSKKRTQTSTDSAKPQSTTNPQGQPNIKIVQSPAQPLAQELNQQTGSTEPHKYTLFTLPNNNYHHLRFLLVL